ncbi:MAG TPA: hypothetical protein ENG48_11160 [Candidatus Atribacteria bacterium]|nr:hypothetical protein [Candidatus Atribacteria bacterium]
MGVKNVTIIDLYNKFLNTENLIELIVGVYEIVHIVKFDKDSNGNNYNLITDYETRLFLKYLCHSWTIKIKATAFKSALGYWIANQSIPYHIIPKKDFEKYVRENNFL